LVSCRVSMEGASVVGWAVFFAGVIAVPRSVGPERVGV
jgi:hypothetical protein